MFGFIIGIKWKIQLTMLADQSFNNPFPEAEKTFHLWLLQSELANL